MIDGVFSAAVQDALALELPGVYIGEPQDDQAIPGKSVLMELQSDIVVGSPLQRGTLTLNVISQADDYTKAEQAAFAAEVDATMRSLVLVSDAVQLYGVVAQSTDNPVTSLPSRCHVARRSAALIMTAVLLCCCGWLPYVAITIVEYQQVTIRDEAIRLRCR